MLLGIEISLLLLGLLGLAGWGIVTGVRSARAQARSPVTPQRLARLAPPFRALLAAALEAERDVRDQARLAPPSLRGELEELAARMADLIARTAPRAEQGSSLAALLARLEPDDPERAPTREAHDRVVRELERFVADLRGIRGKAARAAADAGALVADPTLADDLRGAVLDVEALELAYGELRGRGPGR